MAKEEIISQDFESQIPEEEKHPNLWERLKLKLKKINKKLIILFIGLFILLILTVILITSGRQISQFKKPVFPSPSPAPSEEEIINPSAYATDSGVLEIENKLKEINQDLDKTDLKETDLNPPVLDMEVNFEE